MQIDRLRKEGSRLLKEEQERLKEELNQQEDEKGMYSFICSKASLKVYLAESTCYLLHVIFFFRSATCCKCPTSQGKFKKKWIHDYCIAHVCLDMYKRRVVIVILKIKI